VCDDAEVAQGTAAALKAITIEGEAVLAVAARVRDALPRALDILSACQGRVLISGLGKSGHIGAKIAASLASLGTPAFFIHPTEALHGDSGMVTPNDVAVLIAKSGTTAEVVAFGRIVASMGVPIIALTSGLDSPLADMAEVVLDIGVAREADPHNLAPTASAATTLAVGDALAVGLSAVRQFTPAQFHARHPGGALGQHLAGAE
jgi:arabinose-5-phosphate isomerase